MKPAYSVAAASRAAASSPSVHRQAFAVAFNGYREAGRTFDPAHPIFSATAALVVAQSMQSLVLTSILAAVRPQSLRAVAGAWRSSLPMRAAGRGDD